MTDDLPEYQPRTDKDAITYGGGMAEHNLSIVEKRWESQEFIWELWKSLADREPKIDQRDGTIKLVRVHPDIKPLMSDLGAQRVIQLIRSHVNPVVALSNLSDEDARSLWANTTRKVANSLTLGQKEYGIQSVSDMHFIMSAIKTLTFAQLMRAVRGHESKWSKTQIQELKHDTYAEQRTSGGLFSSFRKQGRKEYG